LADGEGILLMSLESEGILSRFSRAEKPWVFPANRDTNLSC